MTTVDTIITSPTRDQLPEGWRIVKFGDVVRNVDVSVRNPLEQGLERYLGLEHLDPESLHIKRWGLIAEGTSFTRKFTPGQVLFGKRRAYQRKAAVAEFDGICSGDILVFEPRGDDLLSELLPFVVQSDGFFEHALDTSAGSLSPRTRWRDLAEYEFALPPKDEQRRIAEILWAADEAVNRSNIVLNELNQMLKILLDKLLMVGVDATGEFRDLDHYNIQVKESLLGKVPIEWDVCPIENKLSRIIDYRGKTPRKTEMGIPLITAKNVRDGYINEEPREYIDEAEYDTRMTRGIPSPGDILFTTEAPLGNVAKLPSYKLSVGQRIITLCPDHNVLDSNFLFWLLRWSESQQRIYQKATGTTVIGVKQSVFRKIIFRFPPLRNNKEFHWF